MFASNRRISLLVALATLACQPEIGDTCSNAGDCSQQGDRTCDITQPEGYCTVFGCGADSCPSEAVCIGYQSLISIAPECARLQERPRLQRTVCMRSCERNSDCRPEYACVDMSQPNPWGALLVENGGSGKVCALPPPPAPEGQTGVCEPPAPPAPPVLDAGADAAP